MRVSILLPAIGLVAVLGTEAISQQPLPGGGQLPATTVQLPSFSFFTVNTTVSVPDRGGMYMGGVNRARDGRIERGFGPLANRAIGSDRGASGIAVHATIIDRDELDAAVLAAAAKKHAAGGPDELKAAALTRAIGRADEPAVAAALPAGGALPDSVAGIRAQRAAAAAALNSEAAGYLAQAQAAEAEGKLAIAKIYYKMVVRRDTGALQQQAALRLTELTKQSKSVANR